MNPSKLFLLIVPFVLGISTFAQHKQAVDYVDPFWGYKNHA